ncbi:MAG: hypothetical protein AAF418_04395, partial [Pseudomonadota bacterium]
MSELKDRMVRIDPDPLTRNQNSKFSIVAATDLHHQLYLPMPGAATSIIRQKTVELGCTCSPWLHHLTDRWPELADHFIHHGMSACFDETMPGEWSLYQNPDQLQCALAQAKQRQALTMAWAEISGALPVTRTIKRWSDFASGCITEALKCAMSTIYARKGIARFDHEELCHESLCMGISVLALGKLGGYELNYSSDVDLMVLYDPKRMRTPCTQQEIERATRTMIRILSQPSPAGYVFRTDFRLRPDPASTPLAINVTAAESYYAATARAWERAAMIKARPIAGDHGLGQAFLDHIQPFIWRKYLDFNALEDIITMRSKSDEPPQQFKGFDLKKGAGGIRAIEFLVQGLQLVWGGRIHDLRTGSTLKGLRQLTRHGIITRDDGRALGQAYRLLRLVEHRIQMINDAQTHKMPTSNEDFDTIARFCWLDDSNALSKRLKQASWLVFQRSHDPDYLPIAALNQDQSHDDDTLSWNQILDPARLERLGFAGPSQQVLTILKEWRSGRYHALQNQKAHLLLLRMLPSLLMIMGKTHDPNQSLASFDLFLAKLPSGMQLFTTIACQADLLHRLAKLIAGAPEIAKSLTGTPERLDMFIAPHMTQFSNTAIKESFAREVLEPAYSYEKQLIRARKWLGEARFLIDTLLLEGHLGLDPWHQAHSRLAECCLVGLVPLIAKAYFGDHANQALDHFAILGFGGLAAGSLTSGSDLDLAFLWQKETRQKETGSSMMMGSRFDSVSFNRFAQRIVSAFAFHDREGILFAIDTRLRPDGAKSMLATSLERICTYYRNNEAWDWELLALTRSRVLLAPARMRVRLNRLRRESLARIQGQDKRLHSSLMEILAREEAAGHRRRSSLKYRKGGLLELNLLLQTALLGLGDRIPPSSAARGWAMLQASDLLPVSDVQALQQAGRILEAASAVTRASGRKLDQLAESDDWL